MEKLSVGTMIMDHTEELLYPYIDFMASCGMTSCQICRVTDDLLNDRAASDRFINYLREKKIDPVSMFLHTRVRDGGNGLVSDVVVGIVIDNDGCAARTARRRRAAVGRRPVVAA